MKPLSNEDLTSFAPIPFYTLLIYKPTLREIGELTFDRFNSLNAMLLLSQEDLEFVESDKGVTLPITDPYIYAMLGCQNAKYFLDFKLAFYTYFKKDIKVRNGVLSIETDNGDFIFDSTKFYEFQNIVRQINCMDADGYGEILSDNDEMKRKFYEARKKLKRAKAKERSRGKKDNNISLYKLQFALCAMDGGYTISSVQDMTIFQLVNQFKISQARENYLLQHAALCAGGKGKLKYWL